MLSPRFPAVRLPYLDQVELPPVMRVRLRHPHADPHPDVEGAVAAAVRASPSLQALRRGSSVAVAVGSRGIAGVPILARSLIGALQAMGHAPFVVPAMGSHGGATADGQLAVLANLGVTEQTVGAPVRATMETVEYGATEDGIPCRFDAHAAGADAVVVIARVKSHTSFDRDIESGLVKMVAVGLGKQAGASNVHRLGPRGYTEVLPALAGIALRHSPLAFGIAVVENGAHQLVTVEGVEAADFFDADRRLLKQAKALLARLPFAQLDALLVERMGKEISGTGMDIAITGRADLRTVPPSGPLLHRLAVLELTEATHGNAVGVGVADFATLAVANGVDLVATYMNNLTSTAVEKGRIPLVLPTERDVVRALIATSWALDAACVRYCQIRDTLSLDEILVSPALFGELAGRDDAEALSDPEPMRFSDEGRLLTRL